ncbi:MAG: apolipoprotein N-acyltransferase [Armatimonadetes bacterium]|nr:apolipoprotein N-acyltransferase [Armatimonadota bacterium]
MASIARAWPPALSALLLSLAFPPVGISEFALLALIPWFFSLSQEGTRGARSGWVFGVLFMGFRFIFMISFVERWTGSLALALIPWVLCIALSAPWFALFGGLAARAFRDGKPWLVPLLWAGIEVARSYFPVLAFPFALLANPLSTAPHLIGLARFGTVFLVSAWVCLPAVAVAATVRARNHGPAMRYGGAFVVLLLVGLLWPRPGQRPPIRVAIGQIGVDQAYTAKDVLRTKLMAATQRAAKRAKADQADILFLPEGITTSLGTPSGPPPWGDGIEIAAVYGAQRQDNQAHQSALAYDRGKYSYADKVRLVIFGEFVPLRDQLKFLQSFNLPSGDLAPGEKLGQLSVGNLTVGPLLCFEGQFPDLAIRQAQAGSNLVSILSIDDWYQGSFVMTELYQVAAFRAVESGTPVIRVGSLGISGAFAATGEELIRLTPGEDETRLIEVRPGDGRTAFVGIFVFPAFALLSVPVWIIYGKIRRSSSSSSTS